MPSQPRSLDYRADGRLAVLCAGGQLVLVDPTGKQAPLSWQAHPAYWPNGFWTQNGAVRFSPDGHSLVTRGTDPDARVWDAATGHLRYPAFRTTHLPAV